MKKIIVAIALFTHFFVTAQDNPLEEIIKKEIQYNEEDYYDFDLKILPNNAKRALVAMAKYNGPHPSGEVFTCDLIVLLIDADTHKIIDRYEEPEAYVSDAYYLAHVKLDVANYAVADNVRAFGVRSEFRGSSQVFPSWGTSIAMFSIKNNKITQILDDYPMNDGLGERDMGSCTYDGEELTSVLILQKEKTNGYYNLKVKTVKTIKKIRNPKNPTGDCVDHSTKLKPTYKILTFANGKYTLKK